MNFRILVPLIAISIAGCAFKHQSLSDAVSLGQCADLKSEFSRVHPALQTNCASCHSGAGPGRGAFANTNIDVAYREASPRVDLIPRYAGMAHGGCPNCGPALGATIQSLASSWIAAEHAGGSCAQGGGGSDDPPFDDDGGGGSPPPPSINEAGLNAFGAPNGLHVLLKQNCATCHVPGGIQSGADFAQVDVVRSYLAAYTRIDWANISDSKMVNRAETPNHGGGCLICGDPAFVDQVVQRIQAWKDAEAQGGYSVRVSLTSKAVGLNSNNPSATRVIQWALSTDVAPADADLNGAIFSIRAGFARTGQNTYNTGVYAFSEPRLSTAVNAIEVRDLRFVVNGRLESQYATFSVINVIVPSLMSNQLLHAGTALVSVGNTTTDTIGIVFSILRKP